MFCTSRRGSNYLKIIFAQAQEAKEEVFEELMPLEVADGNVDIPTTEDEGGRQKRDPTRLSLNIIVASSDFRVK